MNPNRLPAQPRPITGALPGAAALMLAVLAVLPSTALAQTARPASGPAGLPPGIVGEFRDWSAVCDNRRTCAAWSLSNRSEGGLGSRPRGVQPDAAQGWVMVTWDGAAQARPMVMIGAPDWLDEGRARPSEVRILGNDGRGMPGGVFNVSAGSPDDVIALDASASAAFIAAARRGAAVITGPDARRAGMSASLSGLVAALRAIEARQGRTGTRSAVIDTGPRPAAWANPPSTPTVGVRALRARAARPVPAELVRRQRADCADTIRYDESNSSAEAYEIDRARTLWSLPCGAGAYNTWNRLYIHGPQGRIEPVRFPSPPGRGPRDEPETVINVQIVPAEGVLQAFGKGRGLGDCGTMERFGWTGERFELLEVREMPQCGGITAERWPSVFRAETGPVRR